MQNQEDKTKIRCSLVLLRSDGLLLEQADTASAITGCSPVRAAPPISRACANCSVLPGERPQAPVKKARRKKLRSCRHALAAAGA